MLQFIFLFRFHFKNLFSSAFIRPSFSTKLDTNEIIISIYRNSRACFMWDLCSYCFTVLSIVVQSFSYIAISFLCSAISHNHAYTLQLLNIGVPRAD